MYIVRNRIDKEENYVELLRHLDTFDVHIERVREVL